MLKNRQALSSQRTAFAASLALALAGLVLSIVLVRVHNDAAAGLTSFCTISEEINCDKVALSRWSLLFGVPVAVWGVAGYGLVVALAVWGLSAGRLHSRGPAGLLLVLGLAFSAVSLGLAFISKAVIEAWCLLSWAPGRLRSGCSSRGGWRASPVAWLRPCALTCRR